MRSKSLILIYGEGGKWCMTFRATNHPGLPGTGPVPALEVLGNTG